MGMLAMCMLNFAYGQVDLSINSLVSPVEGDCSGSSVMVSVEVINVGVDTASTFDGTLLIDGDTVADESFSMTILPGDTVIVDFVTAVDLSGGGTFDFDAYLHFLPYNDTILFVSSFSTSLFISPLVSSFPYTEDFEDGGDLDSLWYQGTDDAGDWTVNTGSTSSSNTGPDGDHTTGSGYYVYTEDSSPSDYYPIDLYTPCFDLDGLSNPHMSFWYHSNDANGGENENELEIAVYYGGSWVILDTIGSVAFAWYEWEMDISAYQGSGNVKFRFRSRTDGGSFTHDIAIDDFMIEEKANVDLAMVGLVYPTSAGCFGPNTSVTVQVENAGLDTLDLGSMNAVASANFNGGSQMMSSQLSGVLAPGETMDVTFTNTVAMGMPGLYTFFLGVMMPGDEIQENDTLTDAVIGKPLIGMFPYTQDFSTGFAAWTTDGINSSWELGYPVGSVIDTTASDSNSWVTNLSGDYNNNEESYVIGPCFNFSNLVAPRISMSVWWEIEDYWDGVVLQSSIDEGASWQTVGDVGRGTNWYTHEDIYSEPGDQSIGWSGSGLGEWATASHPLDGLGGEPLVWLRIVLATDASVTEEGFAFDDIVIEESPAVELELLNVLSPSTVICPDDSLGVVVQVYNAGSDTVSSYEVGFAVDGDTVYWIDLISDLIAPGDTVTLQLSHPADYSTVGSHSITAYVEASGDEDTGNDTLTIDLEVANTVSSYPYVEDFEDGGSLDALWTQDGGDDGQDWTVNSGETPSNDTGPDGDHTSGSGYYMYTEDSSNDNNPVNLMTPCFDLDSITSPKLGFWYHSYDAAFGGNENSLHVDAYVDGMWFMDIMTPISHVDDNWNYEEFSITPLQGNGCVMFRFRASTDNDDFTHDIGIDDFTIFEPISDDMAVDRILAPSDFGLCPNDNQTFGIVVVNEGGLAQTDFDLSLEVVGSDTVSYMDSISTNLATGQPDTLFFTGIDLSEAGTYTVTAIVGLSGDGDTSNDTLSMDIIVFDVATEPVLSAGYICDEGESATLMADGTGEVYWYANATGGAALDTGNVFVSPPLNASTTYYASQSELYTENVGPADTSLGDYSSYTYFLDGLVFDVTSANPVTIDSFTCYPTSIGDIVVTVEDGFGTVYGTATYTVTSTDLSSGSGVRMPVGITLPPGETYSITPDGSTVGAFYRNTAGSSFPYTDASGNVSITGTLNTLTQEGYYYFFYDWAITAKTCESDRVAVEAELARDVFEPNDATPVGLPAIGTNWNSYVCDVGDVDLFSVYMDADKPNLRVTLTGATDVIKLLLLDPSNTAIIDSATTAGGDIELIADGLSAGMYVIEVSGDDGYVRSDAYNLRAQRSDTLFSIRTSIDESLFEGSFALYPNPNEGTFFLSFASDVSDDMDISVVDVYGKVVYEDVRRVVAGDNLFELGLGEVSAGFYFVRMKVDDRMFAKRVQIVR